MILQLLLTSLQYYSSIDLVRWGFKGWVEVTSLLSRDGVFMLAMWFCLSSFFSLFTGNISLAGVATKWTSSSAFVASEFFVPSRGVFPEWASSFPFSGVDLWTSSEGVRWVWFDDE